MSQKLTLSNVFGVRKERKTPEVIPVKQSYYLAELHEEFFDQLAQETNSPVTKLLADAIGFYMVAMEAMQTGKTISIINEDGSVESNFVLAMKMTGTLSLKPTEKVVEVVQEDVVD